MRITILGAGALGCYFGAHLQRGGHEVSYVARGSQLQALRAQGVRVEAPGREFAVEKVQAVGTLAEAGEFDLLMFTIKNYDVAAVAAELPAVMGPEAVVMSVQNGVSAPGILAEAVGRDRVLPGAVYMPADIRAPGVVRVTAELQGLLFGEFAGPPTARTRAVFEAFSVEGLRVTLADDIWKTLWEKFIMLASFAAITGVTRLGIGPIRETPETRALLRQLVDEAAAVAHAEHPAVSAEVADTAFDLLVDSLPPEAHASLLDDLERGKRLELDWLSGEVVRRGRKLGIGTPAHGFVQAALAPYVDGPPGRAG